MSTTTRKERNPEVWDITNGSCNCACAPVELGQLGSKWITTKANVVKTDYSNSLMMITKMRTRLTFHLVLRRLTDDNKDENTLETRMIITIQAARITLNNVRPFSSNQ